ncbi:hypothetical protein L6164_012422 [Bauhinia variegata]|uniref:Uncharacterized protein n=1 Tax=Bauhinia variegata TaxID=167791 RepID=A0ACB9PCX2_BAUVA|nr:hypothetical protein L6164_012422 [Bauhinia variegata]
MIGQQKNINDSTGDRTQSLWFRRPAPYPLGHGVLDVASYKPKTDTRFHLFLGISRRLLELLLVCISTYTDDTCHLPSGEE